LTFGLIRVCDPGGVLGFQGISVPALVQSGGCMLHSTTEILLCNVRAPSRCLYHFSLPHITSQRESEL
jgi:hypothetical protein